MGKIVLAPQIYTFDIDSNQHVSNITYIRWMEMGRIKLLEQVGMPVHQIEKLGFAPVLARTEISYKKPLYLGDEVRIELSLSKLRKVSGTIRFDFIRGADERVAAGEQEALFFSQETKKVYKLSDEQRMKFADYLLEEPL